VDGPWKSGRWIQRDFEDGIQQGVVEAATTDLPGRRRMQGENGDMNSHHHDVLVRGQPTKQVLCSWIQPHHQIDPQELRWIEEGGTGGARATHQKSPCLATHCRAMDSVLEEILIIIENAPERSPCCHYHFRLVFCDESFCINH
jgi:hypothetical protein